MINNAVFMVWLGLGTKNTFFSDNVPSEIYGFVTTNTCENFTLYPFSTGQKSHLNPPRSIFFVCVNCCDPVNCVNCNLLFSRHQFLSLKLGFNLKCQEKTLNSAVWSDDVLSTYSGCV